MMRPTDLLRRASALDISVRIESVDEAERVSRVTARPVWSKAGVFALLEVGDGGLGTRDGDPRGCSTRRSHHRDDIYAVCGYDDDRMLRGFTRPAARTTRDLQATGLVAPNFEAALIPIYDGVKAAAFRIPAEMVTILAGDDGEVDGEVPAEP